MLTVHNKVDDPELKICRTIWKQRSDGKMKRIWASFENHVSFSVFRTPAAHNWIDKRELAKNGKFKEITEKEVFLYML